MTTYPEITQPRFGQEPISYSRQDQRPVLYTERSLSSIIAEDNRLLYKKLAGSFHGYVIPSASENNQSRAG